MPDTSRSESEAGAAVLPEQAWFISSDGETFENCPYPSRDAAIEAGATLSRKSAAISNFGDGTVFPEAPSFWIGTASRFSYGISEESIIADAVENADFECGDCSEGWLSNLSNEELGKLQGILQQAWDEWLAETGNVPDFYGSVSDIERIDVIDAAER